MECFQVFLAFERAKTPHTVYQVNPNKSEIHQPY